MSRQIKKNYCVTNIFIFLSGRKKGRTGHCKWKFSVPPASSQLLSEAYYQLQLFDQWLRLLIG